MIVQLLPSQVVAYWDVVSKVCEVEGVTDSNLILSGLLSGKLQCWVSFVREDKERKLKGITLTTIVRDIVSNSRQLLILAVRGFGADPTIYEEGVAAISKWAKKNECSEVVTYSQVEYVLNILSNLGFNLKTIYCKLEI
jgi:hypothetical protein